MPRLRYLRSRSHLASPPSPVGKAFVGRPNDPNSRTLATTAARPAADGIAQLNVAYRELTSVSINSTKPDASDGRPEIHTGRMRFAQGMDVQLVSFLCSFRGYHIFDRVWGPAVVCHTVHGFSERRPICSIQPCIRAQPFASLASRLCHMVWFNAPSMRVRLRACEAEQCAGTPLDAIPCPPARSPCRRQQLHRMPTCQLCLCLWGASPGFQSGDGALRRTAVCVAFSFSRRVT